ncbi:M20/M25/M40 family metallo-hydrolase [bacterium]|nr:M20/M25/M40 family metallo-hydrolase [bacterium]
MIVLSIFMLPDSSAQEATDYLIAVRLNNGEERAVLARLRLPVYYQFESAFICGLSQADLPKLNESGLPFEIIDAAAWSESYFIICGKHGRNAIRKPSSGKVLFASREVLLLKAPDLSALEIARAGLRAVALPKTPKFLKEERILSRLSPALPVADDITKIIAEINPDSLRYFIQSLQDFQTRFSLAPTRHAVAAWIARQYARLGFEQVQIDSFLCYNPWPVDTTTWQKNVIVTLPGSRDPDAVCLIGGHYDCFTYDDPMRFAPGADDNASGTAAAWEIARAMKRTGYQPEATIKFVAFGAEELMLSGGSGCYDMAQKAQAAGMNLRLMINNDMISHTLRSLPASRVSINYYTGSEHLLDMAMTLTNTYTAIKATPGSLNQASDSYPFWEYGFPAIYFEEMDFSPYYHTPQDVIANYSMPYCAEVTKAGAAFLVHSIATPAVVQDFEVVDKGDGASLFASWRANAESDLAGYHVHLGRSSGQYDTLFTTRDTQIILENLTEGQAYFVGVSAYDHEGHESQTVERRATVRSIPLAPINLTDRPTRTHITLAWSPNREYDLLGYRLYRAPEPGGAAILLTPGVWRDTSFVDETATKGIYHYYTVRALDDQLHESAASMEVRSRLVSLDGGILIVDETADGDGQLMRPTDEEVDQYYRGLVAGFTHTEYDLAHAGSIKLADVGAYSTVVWHGNDFSDPAAALPGRRCLQEYLAYGGNLLVTVFMPSRAFSTAQTYPAYYGPGEFIYDDLKLERVEYFSQARFWSASPAQPGYPTLAVDTTKGLAAWSYHLTRIEGIHPAQSARTVYRYHSRFADGTPGGMMNGQPVGIEYLGGDHRVVLVSFPLYFMKFEHAQDFVRYVLVRKFSEVSTVHENAAEMPAQFQLWHNYPNPFNPTTTIAFALPNASFVTLKIYDLLGNEVATLVSEKLPAGKHQRVWEAKGLVSGVYLFQLRAGELSQVMKLMLLR